MLRHRRPVSYCQELPAGHQRMFLDPSQLRLEHTELLHVALSVPGSCVASCFKYFSPSPKLVPLLMSLESVGPPHCGGNCLLLGMWTQTRGSIVMLCLHVCLPRTSLLLNHVVSTPRQGPVLSFSPLLGPSVVPGASWAQQVLFGLKNEGRHDPLSDRNSGLNGGGSWNWEKRGQVCLPTL